MECLNMVQETTLPRPAASLAPQAWIHHPDNAIAGASIGALAGLRFAVKDNIDVAGWPTTAACPAFAHVPDHHASVVRRLLEAGASVTGKTNLDQFACGLSGTRSPYGAVPNAINPLYVSGGSSSGSAYVVATGQVDFALGTDTAGSGRVPAGLNNIVGLKPSRGLISARGVVPAAQAVDCVSIFAPTVAGAVRVLAAAMAHDPLDPYSRPLAMATAPLRSRFVFGVPAALEFFGDEAARTAFDDALAQLKSLGGEAVPMDFAPFSACADMLYGSALVAQRHEAIREFFDAHENEVIEPVRGIIASGRDYTASDLVAAQTRLAELGQQAEALWKGIDLLVVPTAPTHHTIERMQADPVALNRQLGAYTNFVNLLDYAALSVPASLRADGLPFGITLIGRCGSDWQLAELGQRFHHATGLTQGATGLPLPAPQPIPGLVSAPTVRVAVVGAHLSGMPLNAQLIERGATLAARTHTAAQYRLYALPRTTPPKPGLLRVAPGEGERIEVEVWDMPLAHYGSFVALVPQPLSIGTLTLTDGIAVQGFLCEPLALDGATDITHLGGWRAYIASLAAAPVATA
jgi:allophanate hydrolase